MKRDLFTTTALADPRVFQPQVAGFAFGALGGTAAATAGATFTAGAVSGAAFAATAFGGIVVQATVSIGLAAVAAALQGPATVARPSSSMVSLTNPVTYAAWCLGTVRKSGVLGFDQEANKYRHQVTVHCAHPIESFVQHYLDELPVEYDGIGECITDPPGGYARMVEMSGNLGQLPPTLLSDAFGPGSDTEITAAHNFVGLGCTYLRGKRVSTTEVAERYPTGRMWVSSPVFRGLNTVHDPRIDSTGWTDNAALLVAWWLTERMGVTVDWGEVAEEADACDVAVTDLYGTTRAKWRINGTLSDDQDFETQRTMLAAACDLFLYEGLDGKVGFRVGRYIEPTVTLTARDFIELQATSGQTGSSAPTEIVPEYIEPDNDWLEWSTGTWVVGSGDQTQRDTPQIYMVDNHNQAIRIAKRLGTISRAEWQLSGALCAVGYELIGQRFFRLQHAELGIDAVFEVSSLTRESVGAWSLEAVSVTAADFDFDSASEEPERPTISDTDESTISVDDISGVTASSAASGLLRVEWDEQDTLYAQEVVYIRQLDGEEFTATASAPTYAEIRGLEVGRVYEVQLRNVDGSSKGALSPASPIVVTISGYVSPDAVSVTSATADLGRAFFEGSSPFRTSAIRIYHSVTSDFEDATAFGSLVPVGASGPFSITVGSARTDLVTNGAFGNPVGLSLGAGWSVGSGVASHSAGSAGDLEQSVDLDDGADYLLTYEVVSASAGTVTGVLAGSTDAAGAARSAPGTYQDTITAPASADTLTIRADAAFSGSVDNLHLTRVNSSAAPTGYYWLAPVSYDGEEGPVSASYYLIIP
ncbi:hypothetical protein Q4543_19470 [Salipiger sp. 1_MG-2023]|uniref:hypothetical protein n=1 Tax=Salipiger sp. 1_MG-2023 TaxID=3062665 RepID=UPI0026E2E112|nr:hypothetical protein [Salipiger sp. 1_MG-2023]MDO6587695.1 hypothetical protein [Salipiger sp. 1_MG-2023]